LFSERPFAIAPGSDCIKDEADDHEDPGRRRVAAHDPDRDQADATYRGLKADYKSHLSQKCDQLATVQLLRGPVLAPLYRWYDSMKGNGHDTSD
jgi:hypothetical protein